MVKEEVEGGPNTWRLQTMLCLCLFVVQLQCQLHRNGKHTKLRRRLAVHYAIFWKPGVQEGTVLWVIVYLGPRQQLYRCSNKPAAVGIQVLCLPCWQMLDAQFIDIMGVWQLGQHWFPTMVPNRYDKDVQYIVWNGRCWNHLDNRLTNRFVLLNHFQVCFYSCSSHCRWSWTEQLPFERTASISKAVTDVMQTVSWMLDFIIWDFYCSLLEFHINDNN